VIKLYFLVWKCIYECLDSLTIAYCLEGAHEGGPIDFKSLSITGFCPEKHGQCFISFADNPPDPCLLKDNCL
jgi:hypothetical protein